jgi:3-oxoacyl-[acyl-carrier protein] reductase
VILIESTSVKQPIDNLVLSNAIRPGVAGWAKTLSREVGAQNITVNTIAPGRIDTERLRELYDGKEPPPEALAEIPLGRLGSPREIGDVVCFLASDRASYVSGTVITVDGGAGRTLS